MAIDINNARVLLSECRSGRKFGRTAVVGRQGLYIPEELLPGLFGDYGLIFKSRGGSHVYSDVIFENLGVEALEFVDYSDYEGATVLHDMNQPIPDSLADRYDTLIDVGSLEHMYNPPVALSNYMRMVKPGGSLLLMNMPANNCCGHGFYQFSPELFFALFTQANGFEVKGVYLAEDFPYAQFYQVNAPQKVGRRIELNNDKPVLLFGLFTKLGALPAVFSVPIQHDYSLAWSGAAGEVRKTKARKAALARILDVVRGGIRALSGKRYFMFSHARAWRKGLPFRSLGNPSVFTPVDM